MGLPTKNYEKELGYKRVKKVLPKKNRPKLLKNTLYKIILGKGYVDIYFRHTIHPEEISKKRLIYKKVYKDIYDISGRLEGRSKSYTLRTIKKMRIAQFDGSHIRIVLEDDKPLQSDIVIQNNKLRIYLKPSKKSILAKKALPTPPVILNSNKVIVIDPGHGGKDTGAIGYKRKREKDIVLAVAKKVYKALKQKGFKVYLTRRGDYFVTLRNRTKLANKLKANLFLSIHANAAPKRSRYLSMKGLETFFLSPARSSRAKRIAALENRVDMKSMSYYSKNVFLNFINREKTILSNKLAIDVHKSIIYNVRKRYSLKDGGVRPGPFWVLVGAQMPSILVEIGYITNPSEAMRLSNPTYQNLLAKGIAEGIQNYFLHISK